MKVKVTDVRQTKRRLRITVRLEDGRLMYEYFHLTPELDALKLMAKLRQRLEYRYKVLPEQVDTIKACLNGWELDLDQNGDQNADQ